MPAATAAAEPPEEPPGTRSRSQGLCVGKYAEFSVEEPIANSSMLVLPTMTAPASSRRSTTAPCTAARSLEHPRAAGGGHALRGEHVLDADRDAGSGPALARRRRRRPRRPGQRRSPVTVRKALHARVDGGDAVEGGLRQLARAILARGAGARPRGSSGRGGRSWYLEHGANAEVAVFGVRRDGEHLILRKDGPGASSAMTLVSGRVWAVGSTPSVSTALSASKCAQDLRELGAEGLDLGVGELDAGQLGDVEDDCSRLAKLHRYRGYER